MSIKNQAFYFYRLFHWIQLNATTYYNKIGMMDLIGNILMSYQRLCILAHSTGMSRRDVLGGGPGDHKPPRLYWPSAICMPQKPLAIRAIAMLNLSAYSLFWSANCYFCRQIHKFCRQILGSTPPLLWARHVPGSYVWNKFAYRRKSASLLSAV